MKKIAFIVVFLLALLVGVVATRAQSVDASDYKVAFVENGRTHRIDMSSVKLLGNGRVVFWEATLVNPLLVFAKLEVNCSLRKVRALEIALTDGVIMERKTNGAGWMTITNPIAKGYLPIICRPIDKTKLSA